MSSADSGTAGTPTPLLTEALGAARKQLRITEERGVATIEFTRPEKRNAISFEMWEAFARVMPVLGADSDIDVVVLRGTPGGHFSSGADISEFATLRSGIEGAHRYNDAVEAGERAIIDFPRPTIALVQGYAIGGGAQIALACDLRYCDDTARFAITPAKLGLVYGLASTQRLVETVGPAWARWILFTGQQLDASRAAAIGLVHDVLAPADLTRTVYQTAERMGGLARGSIEGAKALVAFSEDDGCSTSPADLLNESILSNEYAEGIASFLGKRPADFHAARTR